MSSHRTNLLHQFYALKERGPHRETARVDPDDVTWLPAWSALLQERYRVDQLEQRIAEIEDRVAS